MERHEGHSKKFDTSFERWRQAVQKVGRWFGRVEDTAKVFWKWQRQERSRAAVRRATAANATRTVDTKTPGGRGASCPKD